MPLTERINEDIKAAMRAGDHARLSALRMALATIRQREVDTREPLTDGDVLALLEKMIKQGRDAAQQFEQAGRADLATKESGEVEVLESYLPEPLTEAEIDALVAAAIDETGAATVKDMGRVMAAIKAQAAGRVDMSAVSAKVRAALS